MYTYAQFIAVLKLANLRTIQAKDVRIATSSNFRGVSSKNSPERDGSTV